MHTCTHAHTNTHSHNTQHTIQQTQWVTLESKTAQKIEQFEKTANEYKTAGKTILTVVATDNENNSNNSNNNNNSNDNMNDVNLEEKDNEMIKVERMEERGMNEEIVNVKSAVNSAEIMSRVLGDLGPYDEHNQPIDLRVDNSWTALIGFIFLVFVFVLHVFSLKEIKLSKSNLIFCFVLFFFFFHKENNYSC